MRTLLALFFALPLAASGAAQEKIVALGGDVTEFSTPWVPKTRW